MKFNDSDKRRLELLITEMNITYSIEELQNNADLNHIMQNVYDRFEYVYGRVSEY